MNLFSRFIKYTFLMTVYWNCVDSKRYYATNSCGHVHGPDHLTVLEFDKTVNYDNKKASSEQIWAPPASLKNKVWECVIVIRGMPGKKQWLGLEWREFHIRDVDINTVKQTAEECGKAYVTISRGSGVKAQELQTICGKDTTQTFFEWNGDSVTIKFYVDFRRNESWPTPAPICTDPADANGVTQLPLCTTPGRKKKGQDSGPIDTFPFPEVYFRLDITSYNYGCSETIQEQTLLCNDSKRCLDWDLMCDFYFSQNCKSPSSPNDKSDQSRDAPSYCFRKDTTTPIPTTTTEPPGPPFDFTPVLAALGAIFGILLFCWCCWRPGYLPWRLSRLRNLACCKRLCRRGRTGCCTCLKCCQVEDDFLDYENMEGTFGRAANRKKPSGRARMMAAARMLGAKGKAGALGGIASFAALSNGGRGPRLNPALKFAKYMPAARIAAKTSAPNLLLISKKPEPYVNTYGQDPDNFASDWLQLIECDGAHLRDQR